MPSFSSQTGRPSRSCSIRARGRSTKLPGRESTARDRSACRAVRARRRRRRRDRLGNIRRDGFRSLVELVRDHVGPAVAAVTTAVRARMVPAHRSGPPAAGPAEIDADCETGMPFPAFRALKPGHPRREIRGAESQRAEHDGLGAASRRPARCARGCRHRPASTMRRPRRWPDQLTAWRSRRRLSRRGPRP